MDVTQYVTALREDLVSAASAGDEQTQRTAALLAAAIEPAARLTVLNALADLAEEVTQALDGAGSVHVRLDGRQVRVVVDHPVAPQPAEPPPPTPSPGDAGDISRITLRLMEEIKGRAERAANQQGLSLNAWISQAVQGALRGEPGWERSARHWSGDFGHGGWVTGGGRGRGGREQSGGQGKPTGRDDKTRLRGWVQG